MPTPRIPKRFSTRLGLTRIQKAATAGLATAGIAALTVTVVPAAADSPTPAVAAQNDRVVAWDLQAAEIPGLHASLTMQSESQDQAHQNEQRKDAERKAARKAAAEAERKADAARQVKSERKAEAERKAGAERKAEAQRKAEAEQKAETERKAAERASSTNRPKEAPKEAPKAAPAAEKTYPDNLDGWIREALDIMADRGIPGTYDGLYRNIMRESSGNPSAINDWDINAQNGTPSIGLLQVIQPTFDTYHVPGTPHDLYDPVANITAAANYAWHRYGSIDNVNGPY